VSGGDSRTEKNNGFVESNLLEITCTKRKNEVVEFEVGTTNYNNVFFETFLYCI
jgi:hypothetical protein